MPPKTTTATKRTKKGGKARQTPIVEAAVPAEEFPDDPPAEEEELDAVVEPEETQGATTSQPAPAKAQPKKRNRVSHREIEDYHFTPEQVTQLVDFLKEHPQMYDRRHREFCNTPAKLDLWQQCAGLFTPAATFLQCRKYFEQKRTAFGKIEAFEMKSGSEARDRTAREEDILETWSFLKGHISHSTTTTSQRFSSDRDSSSSDMSGLSAHSIQRRKAVKKKRTGEPTPSTPPLTQLEVEAQRNRVLSSLLEQASQLTGPKQPQPQGMSTAEMYGKMIGEQLARVKKEDLLTVVIPILNILSNYFNKPQQPQPTPMHPPPAPAQTPVPRNPLPGAGPQHPMHPGPAFPPHYGQEQSPVYPVASTSGLQQQQPPHMPATSYQPTTPVISGYPPYPVPMPSTSGYQPPAMPSTSGYQPPAMPSTSGPIQQKPQPSTYPATYGPGRFTHDTPPVYTPLSGVSSNKPATTHTSPSKRPFLDSLDNLDSLSPLYPPTPSPLQSALRALSTNSDTLNTPVTKPSEEEENDDE